jgi:citrate synthase
MPITLLVPPMTPTAKPAPAKPAAAPAAPSRGLEGIVAAQSSICFIDGEKGILSYRGYDINELAPNASFEEVVFLLWEGHLPDREELDAFRAKLAANRELPPLALKVLKEVAQSMGPMDALRTTVSALAAGRGDADKYSVDVDLQKAIETTAQVATIVAYYHRLRMGKPLVHPDAKLSHAANFLWMLNGEKPTPAAERAFDVALVLHADHDLNASTFSARVTAATLADYHGAITSAVGTLKGPLHGGANIEVMKVLLEIEASHVDPEDWVKHQLAKKRKIPGFGHRVYKTLDPRAIRRAGEEHAVVRDEPQAAEGDEGRQGHRRQRRLLLGLLVLRHGHPARPLHAHLRREPCRRLVRARAGAARRQPAHPSPFRLHGRAGQEVGAHRQAEPSAPARGPRQGLRRARGGPHHGLQCEPAAFSPVRRIGGCTAWRRTPPAGSWSSRRR